MTQQNLAAPPKIGDQAVDRWLWLLYKRLEGTNGVSGSIDLSSADGQVSLANLADIQAFAANQG